MKTQAWLSVARTLALLAGIMDFVTGLGLILAPALTLRGMLAPVPGAEALVYLRFVGVFVFAIGASYLLAWRRGGGAPLRAVFRFTLPFLAAAGLFTGVAVMTGTLAPAWLSVTGTDLVLAGLQIWLLRGAPSADE
jgi:hypothetical protein